MNRILLLGADGQVGWELQRSLAPLGELTVCTRKHADFTRPEALGLLIEEICPSIIVNAAAYTAVDKAETDEATAQLVNADAVGVLAEAAAEAGAWLVHYSTDYVFDGASCTPYREDDATNPLSAYGRTKLEGERRIKDSGCKHLIFRTSWVYAARGNNFAKTMLKLAKERDELQVVADQVGAPTSAELIADVTSLVLAKIDVDSALAVKASGIYHLVASGQTTWHSYAQRVVQYAASQGIALKVTPDRIKAITTAEYPVPAKRPVSSRLSTEKIRRTFSIHLPEWQFHIDRMLNEINI